MMSRNSPRFSTPPFALVSVADEAPSMISHTATSQTVVNSDGSPCAVMPSAGFDLSDSEVQASDGTGSGNNVIDDMERPNVNRRLLEQKFLSGEINFDQLCDLIQGKATPQSLPDSQRIIDEAQLNPCPVPEPESNHVISALEAMPSDYGDTVMETIQAVVAATPTVDTAVVDSQHISEESSTHDLQPPASLEDTMASLASSGLTYLPTEGEAGSTGPIDFRVLTAADCETLGITAGNLESIHCDPNDAANLSFSYIDCNEQAMFDFGDVPDPNAFVDFGAASGTADITGSISLNSVDDTIDDVILDACSQMRNVDIPIALSSCSSIPAESLLSMNSPECELTEGAFLGDAASDTNCSDSLTTPKKSHMEARARRKANAKAGFDFDATSNVLESLAQELQDECEKLANDGPGSHSSNNHIARKKSGRDVKEELVDYDDLSDNDSLGSPEATSSDSDYTPSEVESGRKPKRTRKQLRKSSPNDSLVTKAGKQKRTQLRRAGSPTPSEPRSEVRSEISVLSAASSTSIIASAIAKKILAARAKLRKRKPQVSRPPRKPPVGPKPLTDDLESLLGQANVYFASGKKDEAFRIVEEVIRINPSHHAPYDCLFNIYADSGDAEKQLEVGLLAAHFKGTHATWQEWQRLAALSLESKRISQAISCYGKAIAAEPTKEDLYKAKIALHIEIDEPKNVLKTEQLAVKGLWETESSGTFLERASSVARRSYDTGDYKGALKCWFYLLKRSKLENISPYQELNFYAELLLNQKMYAEAGEGIVEFGGVKIFESDNVEAADPGTLDAPFKFEMESSFPVELKVKLCVAYVCMKKLSWATVLMESLISGYSFETEGDLFYEIAEALSSMEFYSEAERLLQLILDTEQYGYVREIRFRYADVIASQADRELDAVHQFQLVLEIAPDHVDARLKLAELQLKLGCEHEAMETLRSRRNCMPSGPAGSVAPQHKDDFICDSNEKLLHKQCCLMESQESDCFDWPMYIICARQLLAMFFKESEQFLGCSRNIAAVGSLYMDVRHACMEALKNTFMTQLVDRVSAPAEDGVPPEEVYRIFDKVVHRFWEERQWSQLFELLAYGYSCPAFFKAAKNSEIPGLLFHVAIKAAEYSVAWNVVRYHMAVVGNTDDSSITSRTWNAYGMILCRDQTVRYHRFILRAMNRTPNCEPLVMLSGNNSLITGTYTHALVEYVSLVQRYPSNAFCNFMSGILFLHLACKKSISRRHDVYIQALAFLHRYFKLRGKIPEGSYNLGRAFQQSGLLHASLFYYKNVLGEVTRPSNAGTISISGDPAENLAIQEAMCVPRSGLQDNPACSKMSTADDSHRLLTSDRSNNATDRISASLDLDSEIVTSNQITSCGDDSGEISAGHSLSYMQSSSDLGNIQVGTSQAGTPGSTQMSNAENSTDILPERTPVDCEAKNSIAALTSHGQMFNLRPNTAYNLSLLYGAAGNRDEARRLLRQYCTI